MKHTLTHFSLIGVSLIALHACDHPHSMPTGYVYHGDTYKSATPPPSEKITKMQRIYMDANQAEQFRNAVYDMLQKITARAGIPPKPVYIIQPKNMTAFYANIDNDLRESMRAIGYALSDMPTGSYVFAYDARHIEQPRGTDPNPTVPNVELTLKIFDSLSASARLLTEETGQYYIQGAEHLDIMPTQFEKEFMPSRDTIKMQESGFSDKRNPAPIIQMSAPEETIMREPMIQEPGYTPRAPTVESDLYVNERPLMPRTRVSKKIDY